MGVGGKVHWSGLSRHSCTDGASATSLSAHLGIIHVLFHHLQFSNLMCTLY